MSEPMEWTRKGADLMESNAGYRVMRYHWREPGKHRHFEAWPPKRGRQAWPKYHRILGVRGTAKAAMALCEEHFEQQRHEVT